jgi:hypothetical protein
MKNRLRCTSATVPNITKLSIDLLYGVPLARLGGDERMLWAAKRETKREEVAVDFMLRIFDIHMLPMHGEGKEKVFLQFSKEIQE